MNFKISTSLDLELKQYIRELHENSYLQKNHLKIIYFEPQILYLTIYSNNHIKNCCLKYQSLLLGISSITPQSMTLPPRPIIFNLKVMKFLSRAFIQLYANPLTRETEDILIYVWSELCTSSLQTKQVSAPFIVFLYEITWLLYQLNHLGPITLATDEQVENGLICLWEGKIGVSQQVLCFLIRDQPLHLHSCLKTISGPF